MSPWNPDECRRCALGVPCSLHDGLGFDEPVHGFFGLSYANYLVWPRALMQSMPTVWQQRFVALAEEMDERFGEMPWPEYMVTARKGPGGKFMRDPMPHYDRGRTLVEPARRSSEDPGDVAS